jgi:hypothetical protein
VRNNQFVEAINRLGIEDNMFETSVFFGIHLVETLLIVVFEIVVLSLNAFIIVVEIVMIFIDD